MHIHSDFVWVSSSKTKDQYLVFTYKGKNLAKTSSCSLHSFTKQSDPKPTMLYGVPLGPPALLLLGQRCQGAKLQRQKCEDKRAKVRRCEVEVWRLCTAKAKVQNYDGWYYYHSFAYKIYLLIFALCHSIFALLLFHLHSFAFALHRIRRWNLDRTDGKFVIKWPVSYFSWNLAMTLEPPRFYKWYLLCLCLQNLKLFTDRLSICVYNYIP